MKQRAAPVPRVVRSRRDDRYEAGRQAGVKRATAGYVTAVQDDTVSVQALGEVLTEVIYLREKPPVGAIVEVEARGDLLVVPRWYPGPEPVGTTVYWGDASRDGLIQSFNLTTGEHHAVLPQADPLTPAGLDGRRWATMAMLPGGKLLINSTGEPGVVSDHHNLLRIDLSLEMATAVRIDPAIFHIDEVYGDGYVSVTEFSGVYDDVTGLTWTDMTKAPTPFAYSGFDAAGAIVDQRANALDLDPTVADAYIGGRSQNTSVNLSLMGRWLYRLMPYRDGFMRYNLDTDQWQALFQLAGEPRSEFVGVRPSEGTFVTAHSPSGTFVPRIRVHDPDAASWVDIRPNGIPSDSDQIPPPIRSLDPSPPDGGLCLVPSGEGANMAVIHDDKLFYASQPPAFPEVLGVDTALTFWTMDLDTGEITKVKDVPWRVFNASGGFTDWDDPAAEQDNEGQRIVGITLIPPSGG